MTKHSAHLPSRPFFLETSLGRRYCIHHMPPPDKECYGTFIYLHPFAEEMNKSRRMAALQARAFSNIGYGVLQIDLFGCGDSSGEFKEARWNIWRQDINDAINWLNKNTTAPISLWGLRIGALLALDFKKNSNCGSHIENIIMWQPVLNGKIFLNQFLRLQLANIFLSGKIKDKNNTNSPRDLLSAGSTIEVGGYELAPELAAAFDKLEMIKLITTAKNIIWFDISTDANNSISPTKLKIKEALEKKTHHLHFQTVPCLPFWATQEITECSNLISATSKLFNKNSI